MKDISFLTQIRRPTDVTEHGFLCDILWADPSNKNDGWKVNARGASYTFGRDVTLKFLDNNHIDLLCRAHQVVQNGYEFTYGQRVLTLFSAPNYCNSFDNSGAMMKVNKDLRCTFIVLTPAKD